MKRPVLYVLAGVNGAGKSSIGGHQLTRAGMTWYNPDTFARDLVNEYGYQQEDANIAAWSEGVRRLDRAILSHKSFAFETTLGGQTIVQKLISAASTHDILVWFCGLRDAEQHIARVQLRVSQGGHAIPEDRIRQRCRSSLCNIIALMPHLAQLRIYDNSRDVAIGDCVPEPQLLLYTSERKVVFPATLSEARLTPYWAKPLIEAAMTDAA